jgi:hypothetical protein
MSTQFVKCGDFVAKMSVSNLSQETTSAAIVSENFIRTVDLLNYSPITDYSA